MTKSLNSILAEEKSVMLIISHSRAMLRTVENDTPLDEVSTDNKLKEGIEDTALAREAFGDLASASGVRDLNYLWYYYFHQESTREKTIKRVDSTIEFIDKFEKLYAQMDGEKAGRQLLQMQAEQVLERCGNLSVGAATIAPLLEWLKKQLRDNQRGIKIVTVLS